jgi:murein DD-endopeptidase MepM/ murein hydrolase activator NlpD
MSRKRIKARDKVTLKNSRDGAIERSLTSGEDTRISKRTVDYDLRGGAERDSFSPFGKSGKSNRRHKQRKPHAAENGAAAAKAEPQIAHETGDAPKLPETAAVTPLRTMDVGREVVQDDISCPTADHSVAKTVLTNGKSKPPKQSRQRFAPIESNVSDRPEPAPQSALKQEQSALRHDKAETPLKSEPSSGLQFTREDKPPKLSRKQKKRQQRQNRQNAPPRDAPAQNADNAVAPQQSAGGADYTRTVAPITPIIPIAPIADGVLEKPESKLFEPPSKLHDAPQSALNHDTSDKLHFEPKSAETPPVTPTKRKPVAEFAAKPDADTADAKSAGSRSADVNSADAKPPDTPPPAPIADAAGVEDDTPSDITGGGEAEIITPPKPADAPKPELKTDKQSKLQFGEDEGEPKTPSRGEVRQQRKYGKAQTKADKAVTKLDKAKSKLPTKRKRRKERVFDEETGKAKKKLYFESEVKSQGEHLKGANPLRPVKAVGNSALMFAHTKIYQVQRDNVAVEAAHKVEIAGEGITRSALRHHKLAPYKKVEKLERKARKKSINAAYQKALAENPKLKGNPLSKALQKRKIKKDYAKAAREAEKAAKRAKKAGGMIADAGKALAGVIKRHPMAAGAVALIVLLLFCLMSLFGALGSAGSGSMGGIFAVSYLAEDADIDNAELAYTEWETDLQIQIANAQSSHGGYDEYRYNVGDISHNPFELMAYLTAKYQGFTYVAIQADLQALFNEQYSLTFTPTTETRYADPTDANEDGDYEPYTWRVMTVTLTARSFSDVVSTHLIGEEAAHYALLMQSKGARQYLANPFGDLNWLPYVSSYYGYRLHPVSGEKNYHKGVDIALPLGTPILAGQDGVVTFAGNSGDYGNVVVIENADGLTSKYAHCDTISMNVGQTVKIGDVIGTVGSTGNSTGAHLHLEILKGGNYLNALLFADTGSYAAAPNYGYAGLPMGDGTFEALMAAAATVEGMPYVWGGSSPATSFDCSGLICYLYRLAGIHDFGRIGATSIYNACSPVTAQEVRPGDVAVFHSTYSTTNPITHIGIFVGYIDNHPVIFHAGDPIGFTRIDTPYWQSHFYGYARVPSE